MSRILVVDDDELILNAVSTYLARCGYEVLTASNGLQAVQLFRCCPDLIDLVLTVLQMRLMILSHGEKRKGGAPLPLSPDWAESISGFDGQSRC